MNLKIQETTLKVSGLNIALRMVTPASLTSVVPAVLLVHGRTSSQEAHDAGVADQLATSGLVALTLDLPGHGKSEGDRDALTGQVFLEAVLAAYDFLAGQRVVDKSRIFGVGSSFGAYLVMRLSSLRSLHAMVLRVPANYPDKFDTTPIHDPDLSGLTAVTWRSLPRQPGETAAMRAITDFQGQVLLVEAENDELVPRQSILNLLNSAPPQRVQHVVIRNAPHVMYSDPASSVISDSLIHGWICVQAGLIQMA